MMTNYMYATEATRTAVKNVWRAEISFNQAIQDVGDVGFYVITLKKIP